jgi:hypothetical protein
MIMDRQWHRESLTPRFKAGRNFHFQLSGPGIARAG